MFENILNEMMRNGYTVEDLADTFSKELNAAKEQEEKKFKERKKLNYINDLINDFLYFLQEYYPNVYDKYGEILEETPDTEWLKMIESIFNMFDAFDKIKTSMKPEEILNYYKELNRFLNE